MAIESIDTRTLACGMPLLVERMDGVRSAAFAWLLPCGSAWEPEDRQGMSAMWSELVLRGAGGMDSREHADAADRLGASRGAKNGSLAFTISSTMLGTRLIESLALFTAMVRTPRMDAESIDPSRDLCLQAIESLRDDPQERAVIAARERHLPSPMNRSGMGTPEGLRSLTRAELVQTWSRLAKPGGSVFAAAGAVDAGALQDALDGLLGDWSGSTREPAVGATPARGYAHEEDETNQVQIIVVHDAPAEASGGGVNREALLERVVIAVLSGGMSGRLFSEVREKRGLCYSVSAGYRGDRDYGLVSAYVGTTPERAQESLDVLVSELRRITSAEGKITGEEFARAIVGIRSGLVFSGESTGARAASLAADWRRFGRGRTLGEVSDAIASITLDEVNAYLARRRLGTLTIQTLGPKALNPPARD